MMAGAVGVDPSPMTLRALLWMAEGRSRSQWSMVGMICAVVGNMFRDPRRSRALKPDDFSPWAAAVRRSSEAAIVTPEEWDMVRVALESRAEKK